MKKKLRKVLAALLAVVVSASTVNLDAYAIENVNEGSVPHEISVSNGDVKEEDVTYSGWDGVSTRNVYEGDGYKVTFTLTGHWDGGYNANVRIDNIGDSIIENWYLGFEKINEIANIWNAEISFNENNEYTIKNAGWNQDIAVDGFVEFGFSGNENFKGFPEKYELLGSINVVGNEDYSIDYHVDSDWGSGFIGTITITNNTNEILEDWILEFDFEREIDSIWDGELVFSEEGHYVIQNAGYNSRVLHGQKVSFGFIGHIGNANEEPVNYMLYSYRPIIDELVEVDENENLDLDGDGLTGIDEAMYGTNPFDYDTDGDGYSDYYEINHNMNPLKYNEIKLSEAVINSLDDYTEVNLQVLNIDEYYPLEIEYGESEFIMSISGKFSNLEVKSPIEAFYTIYNVKTALGL